MPAKTSPVAARRGKRVTGEARDKAGRRAVELYDQGKSVRQVQAILSWSYGATHRLLREYGAVLRGPGTPGRPRKRA